MHKFPTDLLKEWFVANRRPLPWREEPTPYRVWISEVMLQQTQVAVVIPYFERWMAVFPTIEALARAPLEKVLKCWEGLGYYSRARHLHHAAQYLLTHHGGHLPSECEKLAQIKGIGPYTQGAILSFAFHQRAAAVDGNVLRVLSRFLAFEEEIDSPSARKKLHAYAQAILPEQESWLISEGLIELGATVCTKKAKCTECPLKQSCLAFRHALQDMLPKKRKREETTCLKRQVAVVVCQGKFLVQKRERGKLMADLYEFPYLEEEGSWRRFEEVLGLPLSYVKPLQEQRHSFTRFRAHLFPHLLEAAHLSSAHLWKEVAQLQKLPFSSGHKRILTSLQEWR